MKRQKVLLLVLLDQLTSSPAILLTVAGLGILISGNVFISPDKLLITNFTGLAFILIGVASLMFAYLKVTRPHEQSEDIREELSLIRKEISIFSKESVEKSLKELKNYLRRAGLSEMEFSPEERKELLENIKNSIKTTLSDDFLQAVNTKYGKDIDYENKLKHLRRLYTDTKVRLGREIESLTKRANLNLIIGSLTTFIATILLVYIVLYSGVKTGDLNSFVWHYVPRFFVLIFIEVFSFFFLRLYKSSLNEIKYFQNEITTVDGKLLGLETALISEDHAKLDCIIQVFSQTERNFILDKGQTTVDLKKYKSDSKTIQDFTASIKKLIKTKAK